jgi:hypothetical protein
MLNFQMPVKEVILIFTKNAKYVAGQIWSNPGKLQNVSQDH